MTKASSIIFIFLVACSTHSDMDVRDANILKQENIAYSKVINHWIDGEYIGNGKNKQWIPGHWEKRLANPIFDSEYVWESGEWRKE